MLTGLCSAMYLQRIDGDGASEPKEVKAPSPDAALFIHTRGGEVKKATIPADCLAFQTGEALELATGGRLRATPHLVRGGSWTPGAEKISRGEFTGADSKVPLTMATVSVWV